MTCLWYIKCRLNGIYKSPLFVDFTENKIMPYNFGLWIDV